MSHVNRLFATISNAPGTSGALTIAAAVSGPYRTFGAAQDGQAFDVSITDSTAWEVRTGCVYTHSGTSLSRGTLEDSSTGSAIALTSSAQVMVVSTAASLNVLLRGLTPGGRLTTESGVPVSTADRTAQSTLYYTPFVHDQIVLWTGQEWRAVVFTETALALSGMTANRPHDVFGYLSGGVLALELLAWTSDTVRATGVSLQDGRYCETGDKTRLLLGTIYATAATTTDDALVNRFVGNLYNLVDRVARGSSSTSHTYTTATTREINGGTSVTRARWVEPLGGRAVTGALSANLTATGSAVGHVGLSFNATSLGDPHGIFFSGPAITDMRAGIARQGTSVAGLNFATATQFGSTGVTWANVAWTCTPAL